MTTKIVIKTIALCSLICSCSAKNKKNIQDTFEKIPNSILIVYTSGEPFKTISDIMPEEAEAYTGPTPTYMNVEIISKRLFQQLKKRNYTVRLARANEINSYKEILQYDMLIIGTPTYFWDMHWEIKKMLDTQFEKIYITKRDEFKKMKHIVFAMSEYGGCAENANEKMTAAIKDCSAKTDSSMVFITKMTMEHYEAQIADLANIAEHIMITNNN